MLMKCKPPKGHTQACWDVEICHTTPWALATWESLSVGMVVHLFLCVCVSWCEEETLTVFVNVCVCLCLYVCVFAPWCGVAFPSCRCLGRSAPTPQIHNKIGRA